MATLQKIRAKGPLLVIVIGLALFAFIAEEAMRCSPSSLLLTKASSKSAKFTESGFQYMNSKT